MLQRYERELTDDERSELQNMLAPPGPVQRTKQAAGCFGCLLVILVPWAAIAGGIVAATGHGSPGFWLWLGIGTLIATFLVWCVLWVILRGKSALPELREAAENARAAVLHATATGAVEIEQVDDEGAMFFLDVGDGRLLYLAGQYLWSVSEPDGEGAEPCFPNTEFEVRLVAELPGLPARVGCLGDYLPSERTVSWDDLLTPELKERAREEWPFLRDGDLVKGSLATLEEDVRCHIESHAGPPPEDEA